MRIYLNNRFVPDKQARVSVFDHGFLYGDGVFETLRVYEGRIFLLNEHLSRLRNSAKALEISLPVPLTDLRRLLYQSLNRNRLRNALVRISVSRGPGPIGLDTALCREPTLIIIPRMFNGYPPAANRKGLKIAIVSVRRISPEMLDPQIKSMNFLNNIMAKIQAKRARADEGLMLSRDGCLSEGSISNIFLVKNSRLYTPAAGVGILMGITRKLVIALAQKHHIPVIETRLYPSDLYGAEECFLTNTSMEVMPVSMADGRKIGTGKPGPVTRRLQEIYTERVRNDCGIMPRMGPSPEPSRF
jgi:branched-chain amino acid aminotransferase